MLQYYVVFDKMHDNIKNIQYEVIGKNNCMKVIT